MCYNRTKAKKEYLMKTHQQPIATVDAVLLTLHEEKIKAVLIRRPEAPYAGHHALPGGYVHTQEDTNDQDAIKRVVRTKLGIQKLFLEQLFTVANQSRDPRGWSLSVVFLGIFSPSSMPDLPEYAEIYDVEKLPQDIAFDHEEILQGAVARLKGKGAYSTLPAKFLDSPFTLTQLQNVYEIVLGKPLETSAFRRKIKALDLLEKTEQMTSGQGRPSQMWTLKETMQTFDKRSLLPAGF